MLNAMTNVPLRALGVNLVDRLEKSMMSTSNMASASTTKRIAMPRLNHGDELMVPNVPAVRMTMRPSTP